jgi:hypothetical protein
MREGRWEEGEEGVLNTGYVCVIGSRGGVRKYSLPLYSGLRSGPTIPDIKYSLPLYSGLRSGPTIPDIKYSLPLYSGLRSGPTIPDIKYSLPL